MHEINSLSSTNEDLPSIVKRFCHWSLIVVRKIVHQFISNGLTSKPHATTISTPINGLLRLGGPVNVRGPGPLKKIEKKMKWRVNCIFFLRFFPEFFPLCLSLSSNRKMSLPQLSEHFEVDYKYRCTRRLKSNCLQKESLE